MANMDIRRTAKANGVPLWKICEVMGVSEPTLTRRLRKELPESEKEKIRNIIAELAAKEAV